MSKNEAIKATWEEMMGEKNNEKPGAGLSDQARRIQAERVATIKEIRDVIESEVSNDMRPPCHIDGLDQARRLLDGIYIGAKRRLEEMGGEALPPLITLKLEGISEERCQEITDMIERYKRGENGGVTMSLGQFERIREPETTEYKSGYVQALQDLQGLIERDCDRENEDEQEGLIKASARIEQLLTGCPRCEKEEICEGDTRRTLEKAGVEVVDLPGVVSKDVDLSQPDADPSMRYENVGIAPDGPMSDLKDYTGPLDPNTLFQYSEGAWIDDKPIVLSCTKAVLAFYRHEQVAGHPTVIPVWLTHEDTVHIGDIHGQAPVKVELFEQALNGQWWSRYLPCPHPFELPQINVQPW